MDINEALTRLKAGDWAFIDAGASVGGSLEYCEKRFRRGGGIGFDIRGGKVAKCAAAGFDVCKCDLRTQQFPPDCVSFASMMDFLEHLPSMRMAEEIMLNMAVPARDFLFIRHPCFNDTEYFASLGLKLTWSDWKGHTNMAHTDEFRDFFNRQGWEHWIIPAKQIVDSSCPFLVPLGAPRDSVRYDPRTHGPKPRIVFERFVFSFCDMFVKLNPALPDREWLDVVRRGSWHRLDMSKHHEEDVHVPQPGLASA